MLTAFDIVMIFKRIENILQNSMMRNFERHKAEELKEGFEWEMWQSIQLKELQRYRRDTLQKYEPELKKANIETLSLFKKTAKNAESDLQGILSKHGKKEPGFFKYNDKKLNALLETTEADFSRAEVALFRQANDQYRKIITNAQVYAATGATYEQAVDMASKDFLRAGINCIVYKNGARHTISDYVSMAIRTGQKRAYLMGEGNARDEYGIHTIRVNQRLEGCPYCVPWQGRVLVDDVYCSGTREEAEALNVPTLSDAIKAGFLHPNCQDTISTYIPGVSKPGKPWTQDEIDALVNTYNKEQKVKHALDMTDSYKRMAECSLDEEDKKRYSIRAENWRERAKTLEESL